MTYRYLPATLADQLRAAGLTVVEIDGWQHRGRGPEHGEFAPVGVLWHHTGSSENGKAYAQWLATVGRSDLPAPLCHLSIGRDGTVYVIAAGRANHAGVAKASGTVAAGDGNKLYIGVECQNNGTEGWGKPQYDAMVTTGVVLKGIVGTSVQTQRGHKETSVTGKWDPGALNMDKFRADIDAASKAPAKHAAAPVKTPHITAALTATSAKAQRAALAQVVEHGSPSAMKAAQGALKAYADLDAATAQLRKLEVK